METVLIVVIEGDTEATATEMAEKGGKRKRERETGSSS